jgi:hypothetical protein
MRVTCRLTMRLNDARLRRQQPKLIYPNHGLPPWLTEDATLRSLEPIVRRFVKTFAERIHLVSPGSVYGVRGWSSRSSVTSPLP